MTKDFPNWDLKVGWNSVWNMKLKNITAKKVKSSVTLGGL